MREVTARSGWTSLAPHGISGLILVVRVERQFSWGTHLIFAAVIIGVIAILVLSARQTPHDRAAKPAEMSEKERQAYVAKTHRDFQAARRVAEDERANRDIKKDESKAANAMRLIEVAVAEGRRSVRVWVPQKDVEAVRRWGARNGYTVLVARERGSQGDAQLSITWASRRT